MIPDTKLTGTMQLCLDSIDQAPGTTASELPGGKNTIAALMRRGLVEIDEDERVYRPEHEHVFKTSMHLDGCHSYSTAARCECGTIYNSYGERSVKSDPYSAIWMDPADNCERCKAILAGAPRRFEVVITRTRQYAAPVAA